MTSTGAPKTLELARDVARLANVRKMLDRLIEESGGRAKECRHKGTGDALVAAVSASPDGRAWLSRLADPGGRLLSMVRIADAYGRDGVFASASFTSHLRFVTFDDRGVLIRQYPMAELAAAKAASLRRGDDVVPPTAHKVSRVQVRKLANRTGVSTREAAVILCAVVDGRSKAKLIRAVNEACKMVEADPNSKRLREAA